MEATVIYEGADPLRADAEAAGDDLWVSLADLQRASGWEVKPEGVCRESICIPLPADGRARYVDDPGGRFNLAGFARLIEQPFAHSDSGDAWHFGPPSWEWQSRTGSQEAPDFTLPDFAGASHSLSDYRGRKVFLLCWSSW